LIFKKKNKQMKIRKHYWCVFDKVNELICRTLKKTRKESIKAFKHPNGFTYYLDWNDCYRQGFRCKKVMVTVVEKEKIKKPQRKIKFF